MDSSTPARQLDPSVTLTEEEAAKLRTQRVSLNKASALLGHSNPHVRRLVDRKQLISVRFGNRDMITLYEIRRFLQRGNATEQDWKDQNGE